MTRPPTLTLTDLGFTWPGTSAGLAISAFSVAAGEAVLLVGPSGSGKSTLLSLVCGIVAPQRGRVTVVGQPLGALLQGQRDRFRGEHVGVIFQQFNLLPYASVLDNILLALRFAPQRRQRSGDGPAAARTMLARLGLSADLAGRRAGDLSVGQQQRVAAARALIGEPPLILADEPTSALDGVAADGFLDLLFEVVRQQGASLLLVSHDMRLARRFDRVVPLETLFATGGEGT